MSPHALETLVAFAIWVAVTLGLLWAYRRHTRTLREEREALIAELEADEAKRIADERELRAYRHGRRPPMP